MFALWNKVKLRETEQQQTVHQLAGGGRHGDQVLRLQSVVRFHAMQENSVLPGAGCRSPESWPWCGTWPETSQHGGQDWCGGPVARPERRHPASDEEEGDHPHAPHVGGGAAVATVQHLGR